MSTITVYDAIPQRQCGCGGGGNQLRDLSVFAFEAAAVRAAGGSIKRYSFDDDPMAFTANPINVFVADRGMHQMPVTVVDGEIVLFGRYPTRAELVGWAELTDEQRATLVTIPEETLPMAGHNSPRPNGGGCACGGRGHGGGHGHGHGHGHGGSGCGCGGH